MLMSPSDGPTVHLAVPQELKCFVAATPRSALQKQSFWYGQAHPNFPIRSMEPLKTIQSLPHSLCALNAASSRTDSGPPAAWPGCACRTSDASSRPRPTSGGREALSLRRSIAFLLCWDCSISGVLVLDSCVERHLL